jgi:hypothetical protein
MAKGSSTPELVQWTETTARAGGEGGRKGGSASRPHGSRRLSLSRSPYLTHHFGRLASTAKDLVDAGEKLRLAPGRAPRSADESQELGQVWHTERPEETRRLLDRGRRHLAGRGGRARTRAGDRPARPRGLGRRARRRGREPRRGARGGRRQRRRGGGSEEEWALRAKTTLRPTPAGRRSPRARPRPRRRPCDRRGAPVSFRWPPHCRRARGRFALPAGLRWGSRDVRRDTGAGRPTAVAAQRGAPASHFFFFRHRRPRPPPFTPGHRSQHHSRALPPPQRRSHAGRLGAPRKGQGGAPAAAHAGFGGRER